MLLEQVKPFLPAMCFHADESGDRAAFIRELQGRKVPLSQNFPRGLAAEKRKLCS
jgi:hypothetical protein